MENFQVKLGVVMLTLEYQTVFTVDILFLINVLSSRSDMVVNLHKQQTKRESRVGGGNV